MLINTYQQQQLHTHSISLFLQIRNMHKENNWTTTAVSALSRLLFQSYFKMSCGLKTDNCRFFMEWMPFLLPNQVEAFRYAWKTAAVMEKVVSILQWLSVCTMISVKLFCSIHQQHIHAHNCLTAFCSGLPGWASTRRNIHPLTPILIIRHPSTKKSNKGLKWLFQQQRLVPWTQPVKMRRMMNVWRMALGEPSQHACIMTGVSSVNADQPIIATIITALAPQRSLR